MKRINLIMLSLLMLALPLWAEDEPSKDNFVLPKAGDIALGIDLVPMLGYVGDIFNNTMNNSYSTFGGEPIKNFSTVNNPSVSIMGKYMITDNIAARVNIGILSNVKYNKAYSYDDAALLANPLSQAKVEDIRKVKETGASFMLGAEYRRGYKRIQGFGGLNLIYGYSKKVENYSYGNALTEVNQTPSRQYASTLTAPNYWTERYTVSKYNVGNNIIGLGAHVGVEVFIISHLSLGGEIFLNGMYEIGSSEYEVMEGYNTLNDKVEEYTELGSPGNNEFIFGTENLGGKLYMSFYF